MEKIIFLCVLSSMFTAIGLLAVIYFLSRFHTTSDNVVDIAISKLEDGWANEQKEMPGDWQLISISPVSLKEVDPFKLKLIVMDLMLDFRFSNEPTGKYLLLYILNLIIDCDAHDPVCNDDVLPAIRGMLINAGHIVECEKAV